MQRETNFISDRCSLECELLSASRFVRKYQVTSSLVDRIGLEKTLEGHRGCVNCLQWNEAGSLLASGSDDCTVILWDARYFTNRLTLATGHVGNIFSVKFLYKTNFIATGAGDSKIRVHDIEKKETVQVFNCCVGRVKRLETIPTEPFLIWSASEDGTVRQFDVRCSKASSSANILVDLAGHIGLHAEAKCLAINPTFPSMLAVGANDTFIRLYDRRKLSPHENNSQEPTRVQTRLEAAQTSIQMPYNSTRYLVPGHLPRQHCINRRRSINATYVSFSKDGQELLANLGGEQIYAFETRPDPASLIVSHLPLNFSNNGNLPGVFSSLSSVPSMPTKFTYPPTSVDCKITGETDDDGEAYCMEQTLLLVRRLLSKRSFQAAIEMYNKAIHQWPNQPRLYIDRVVALIKRCWDGDVYASLRDCSTALQLMAVKEGEEPTPALLTVKLLMVRCLLYLGWIKAARSTLNSVRPYCLSGPSSPLKDATAMEAKDVRSIFDKLDRETKEFEARCSKTKSANVDMPMDCVEENMEGTASSVQGSSPSSSSSTQSPFTSNNMNSATNEVIDANKSVEQDNCRCVECLSAKSANVVPNSFHFFERRWRQEAVDYKARFIGHCNGTTDIKEANFFGGDGQYVVAGSDCGCMFVWERSTCNIVRILQADNATVNCVQPHPYSCLIASSGIESVVRIWSPRPEDEPEKELLVTNHHKAAKMNQKRLRANPLEMMARQMVFPGNTINPFDDGDDDEEPEDNAGVGGEGEHVKDEKEEKRGKKGEAMEESGRDEQFEGAPVVSGASLVSTDSLPEHSHKSILLDPEIASTALSTAPPQMETEEQYVANRRQVMTRIVLGFPSEGASGADGPGFFFRTFTGEPTTMSSPHPGNDNHHHPNSDDDNDDPDESGNVLEFPCTTS